MTAGSHPSADLCFAQADAVASHAHVLLMACRRPGAAAGGREAEGH